MCLCSLFIKINAIISMLKVHIGLSLASWVKRLHWSCSKLTLDVRQSSDRSFCVKSVYPCFADYYSPSATGRVFGADKNASYWTKLWRPSLQAWGERSCQARSPLAGCIRVSDRDGGNAAGIAAELHGPATGESRRPELAQRTAPSTACPS